MSSCDTHILILEDNPSDAELVQRELRKAGLEFTALWAPDKKTYLQALNEFVPDLILADYSLPSFDGMVALALARQSHDHIPVIIVSGVIGEETAIETLKAGATDYVMKNRLGRLGPVVRRALEEARQLSERRGVESELRRSEAALRESEERLRLAQQAARIGSFEWNIQTDVNTWTPELEAMYGLKPGEFGGTETAWEQLVHPEDRQLALGLVDRAFETGQPGEGEWRVQWRDGSVHWIFGRFQVLRDEAGKPLRLTGVNIDITERKRAEERLRDSERLKDSERRLADIIEFLPDATFALDNAGRITAWNKAMEELTGASAMEVLGKGNHEHTYRLYGKRIPCLADALLKGEIAEWTFSNIIQENEIIKAETYIPLHKPGGVWLSIKVAPIYDAQGNIVGVIDACRDITDRKRIEEALRESEEHYRTLFDEIDEGFCIIEVLFDENEKPIDYRFLETNPAFEKHTGLIAARGKRMRELVPTLEEKWYEIYGNIALTGEPVRFQDHVEQFDRWYDVYAFRFGEPENRQVAVLFNDINERRRIEEALRQGEQEFRTLAETVPQIVWATRPDGWNIYFNQQWVDYTGLTLEESYGHGWITPFHPDEKQRAWEAWQRATQHNEPYSLECRLRRADGVYRWWLIRGAPIRNADGEIQKWFGTCTDIEEIKQAEKALHTANTQLAEADRRKDEFLAMLAHELRNPLAPIRYAAQMLHMSELTWEQIQKQREVIDRQVSHMSRLLDDLLEVSRITRGKITLKREIVDLRTITAQALDSLRPMIEGRGQIFAYDGPSSPLPVDGDPTRLEQIIHNLLHNANKYTEAGGCIKLSLGLDTEQEWWAVVRVSDSGIGIAPEMLPHVFEVFVQAEHSLARQQGGLGIGLAMVKNLVQMHGGSVEAHSAGQGHGSEFMVRLPLVQTETEITTPNELPLSPASRSLKILVVDDVADTAQSLAELLGMYGHQTRVAYSGSAALETTRDWHPEIVLLDIGMPGMDGYEVARSLRAEHGKDGMIIIALTGYGQASDRAGAKEVGFDDLLVKPVDLDSLRKALEKRT